MPAYAGSALYIEWVGPSGTTVITGKFRQFNSTPTVENYDQSGGADTHRSYLPGIKDWTGNITYVDQAAGTTILDELAEGTNGTLVVGPEGTATGKRKETYPAISQGPQRSQPYTDIVVITCNFQGTGTNTPNGTW